MDYNNGTQKEKRIKEHNWGTFISKVVVASLIFGLLGGGVFTAFSYVGLTLTGRIQANADGYFVNDGNADATTSQYTGSKDNSAYKSGAIGSVTTTSALETTDVAAIAENVMPCIVAITNYTTVTYSDFWGSGSQSKTSESAGSGIIMGQDDTYLYIATNNHVVDGAEKLSVQFCNDYVVDAAVKGTYEAKDLAVVQVEIDNIPADTVDVIKIADIGDSTQVRVGENAIAIGNALGYGQSVTTGIISALDREVTVESTSGSTITNDNLIQTDAAINPGNSGGALINTSGQVIGINSAKYSSTSVEGFGFAIPMEDAWPIIEQLITREKVDEENAAFFGIQGQDVTSSLSEAYGMPQGVYVYRVVAGSPAAEYGIQSGDVITSFDGQTVYTMAALKEQISFIESGTTVNVVLQRQNRSGDYEEMTIQVELGSASDYTQN